MLCVSFISTSVAQAANAGQVGSWSTGGTLPSNNALSGGVVHNDRVYMIGGWNGSGGTSFVNYASLNTNGTIGSWTTSGNTLPQNVRANNSATYNGYLYSVGGIDDGSNRLNSVSYATINNDGTVGSWATSGNTLPITIQNSAVFAYDGYLYVVGGYSGSPQTAVYYAAINNDGTLGTWSTNSTSLPSGRSDISAVAYNGRVYIVGGTNGSGQATDTVYYATINSNHTIGSWTTNSTVTPAERYAAGVVEYDGYLYVLGGTTLPSAQASVYHAQIKADGSVGSWTTSSNSLPGARKDAVAVANNGFIYMLGGRDASNNTTNTAYYAPLTAASRTVILTNPVTSKPIVISTPAGTDLTCSSSSSEASLATADSIYDYPVGLASFCYTTNASSNQVTVTFVTNLDASKVVLRHFNSTTNTYSTVLGATFTATTYGGEPAIQATYTIEDNGPYDTDPTIGSVSDPVGLSSTIGVPNTGFGPQQSNLGVEAVTAASLGVAALIVSFKWTNISLINRLKLWIEKASKL